MMRQKPATIAALTTTFVIPENNWNSKVIGITIPRTKFGIVEAAVALMFVPNCSAAIVTKTAQYPAGKPVAKQII